MPVVAVLVVVSQVDHTELVDLLTLLVFQFVETDYMLRAKNFSLKLRLLAFLSNLMNIIFLQCPQLLRFSRLSHGYLLLSLSDHSTIIIIYNI